MSQIKTKKKRIINRTSQLGFKNGFNRGYDNGYNEGFNQGWQAGGMPFEGTSIIIPNYNQKDFLKECIESIRAYTPESYELIIIDNGSIDGSVDYIRSINGKVRFRALETNLGFAGAVNQGLMMARGTTLLIMNNDIVVTHHWLSNLLTCLHSNPTFGIVGPVTNYISGEQLISTDYDSIEDMHRFAASYNRLDQDCWTETGRLTGFCMLMRREVFQRLGYFDEGFEIGNCEDDDYGIRVRMLGLRLMIARDTFIHHYGSVSMKALKSQQFDQVYENNMIFYINKWGEPHSLLAGMVRDGDHLRMVDLYPNLVTVQGIDSVYFWVENGMRYKIETEQGMEVTRIAQVDLRNWVLGGSLSMDEWMNKQVILSGISSDGALYEGSIVKTPDNIMYRYDRGKLRHIVNDHTLNKWKLHLQNVIPIEYEEKNRYSEGNPIISPPVIKAENL